MMQRLLSSDLRIFLQACPAEEVTELARYVAAAIGTRYRPLTTLYLQRSLNVLKAEGYQTIPDICQDLSSLGSNAAGRSLAYAEWLPGVAERHGIKGSDKIEVAEIERLLLQKYDANLILTASPGTIQDKGGTDIGTKLLRSLPLIGRASWIQSSDWHVVTVAALRIGIMRVLGVARTMRGLVEI